MPVCARSAARQASGLVRRALVTKQPIVVLPRSGDSGSSVPRPVNPGIASIASYGYRSDPGGAVHPASTAPSVSMTSPRALTATTAPTTTSPERSTAAPNPPGTEKSRPATLPIVQPRPTPTRPVTGSSALAASQAAQPAAAVGRSLCGEPMSYTTAAPMTGTMLSRILSPRPCAAHQRTTPSAAARPNTLLPHNTTP